MIHELVDSPGERDPEDLHDEYRRELAAIVEETGVARAAKETGIEEARVSNLAEAELELSEAAAVLSLKEDRPDAEAIEQETLDHLLLGMTTAVLDVDALAANVSLDRSATAIQQRIEGRTPMTLREFAHVHAFIESRKR